MTDPFDIPTGYDAHPSDRIYRSEATNLVRFSQVMDPVGKKRAILQVIKSLTLDNFHVRKIISMEEEMDENLFNPFPNDKF